MLEDVLWDAMLPIRPGSKVLSSQDESLNDIVADEIDDYNSNHRPPPLQKHETRTRTSVQRPAVRNALPQSRVKQNQHRSRKVPRSKGPAKKEQTEESLVDDKQSLALLLEPDGDDPHPQLSSPFSSSFIRRYLSDVFVVLAGLASPAAVSADYGRSFSRNVMAAAAARPAQMHAMIYSMMMQERTTRGIDEPSTMELMVGAEAVKHLNVALSASDPQEALSDDNIWTVLALAYHGRPNQLRPADSYPKQSTMRELQGAHVYLRMELVVEHVMGLVKMVQLLGDLGKIKLPGMAPTISFGGVMAASRTVSHPVFPFVAHTTTFINAAGRLFITEHERQAVEAELGQLGHGFRRVWSPGSTHLPAYIQHMLETIDDICDFTMVVENHASGRWIPQISHEIIDQRNYVQHKLMSVPTEEEVITAVARSDPQYEICRLACLIYSFLIILPMPPVFGGAFDIVTARLRQALEDIDSLVCEDDRMRLEIWALLMGAIASMGLPDHGWFLQRIGESSQQCSIRDWQQLKSLLVCFLWHPRTSDGDGSDVWDAVQTFEIRNIAK